MKKGFQRLSLLLGMALIGLPLYAQQTPDSPASSTGSQASQQSPSTPDTQQTPQQTPSDSQPATPPSSSTPGAQQPGGSSGSMPDAQGSKGQMPSDSTAQSGANDKNTFTGTIVKSGDKYVLQDAATGTTYDVDHQDEVKKFEGKKVRVHGTLDPSGKMIHLQ